MLLLAGLRSLISRLRCIEILDFFERRKEMIRVIYFSMGIAGNEKYRITSGDLSENVLKIITDKLNYISVSFWIKKTVDNQTGKL